MVENSRIVMPSNGFINAFLFSIEGRLAWHSRHIAPSIYGSIIYLRCDRFNPLVRKRPNEIAGHTSLRPIVLIAGRWADQAKTQRSAKTEVE
jgi:hypothetical protein